MEINLQNKKEKRKDNIFKTAKNRLEIRISQFPFWQG